MLEQLKAQGCRMVKLFALKLATLQIACRVFLKQKAEVIQNRFWVYGREGKLSPRSRTPIKKIKYEGRWTYYCDTQV